MDVSLVATVRNEASSIAALIESMLAQTQPPAEIVLNDNGSVDATVSIIERAIAQGAPIKLVRGVGNIPTGRNRAIQHSSGAIVACCDAGLTLPPDWLEQMVAPLKRGQADIVSGFFVPAPRSLWELALGATAYPALEDIRPERFLPGGNSVAFTRAAWEAAGGYPEWADTCEDLIFDLRLKRRGFCFSFVPAAVSFRPRETPGAFFRQYFTYARGDGVANLWPRRHAIRYASYIGLALLLRAARRRPARLLALLPGVIAHTARPYRRLWRSSRALPLRQRATALALVPLIRLIGDVAKLCGYPAGLWRWLRASPASRALWRGWR